MKLIKYNRSLIKAAQFKLAASTIVETLVASVIIVLIFSIASLTLNNVFKSQIQGDTSSIENHINKLVYLQKNNMIKNPFYEDFEGWELNMNSVSGALIVNAEKLIEQNKINSFQKTFLYESQ